MSVVKKIAWLKRSRDYTGKSNNNEVDVDRIVTLIHTVRICSVPVMDSRTTCCRPFKYT